MGGSLEALGNVVEHGVALGVDRGAGVIASVTPAFLVVGQLGEIGEILQPPCFVETAVVEQHFGQGEEELSDVGMILVLMRQGHGLNHELQRAYAVAFCGVDGLAAAAFVSSLELAGHDEAMVRQIHVVAGGRPEKPPVVRVDLDGFLDKLIGLVDAIQSLQALEGGRQIVAYLVGVGGRVQDTLAEGLVGVVEIAVFEQLCGLLFAVGVRGRWRVCGSADHEPSQDDCDARENAGQSREVHRRSPGEVFAVRSD